MDSFARQLINQVQGGNQTFSSETYVSSPPALVVLNNAGQVFELGTKRYVDPAASSFRQQYSTDPRGEFAFNVIVNGVDTGEFASRIENKGGRVRIFCRDGWKTWNGRTFF